MARKCYKLIWTLVVMMMVALSSCSVSRHLPEDTYLLDKVRVVSEEDPALASSLRSKVRQKPNTRFLGLFRWPLRVYCLAGNKDNMVNRFLKNVGEAPCVYDAESAERSCGILQQTLVNRGYLNASVVVDTVISRHKVEADYYVSLQKCYQIASIHYQAYDSTLLACIYADTVSSVLKVGMPLDVNKLDEERSRMTDLLQNNGYYSFKKDYVTYLADTARNSSDVNLTIRIRTGHLEQTADEHRVVSTFKPYRIENVNYLLYPPSHTYQRGFAFTDSLHYDNCSFMFGGELSLRPQVLRNTSVLQPGAMYSASTVRDSYALYGRLGALKYTNINFVETSDSTLDCNVVMYPSKKVSLGAELDLTNTAGDFGVSAALAFTNRNLFRGSEVLSLKLRGAYENITHLSDYTSDDYIEYGVDVGLSFPRFIVPFVSDEVQRRSKATTQLELQYNAQKRPEFDRDVFSASWSYLWNTNRQMKHRFDLLGVNFVSVPRKEQAFIDNYLDQYNSRNSIMKFNYEDLFIFRTGYDFYYTSPNAGLAKDYFDISYSVRAAVEASGNMLYLLSNALQMRQDSLGQFRLFDIAYAQYLKSDVDWTVNMNFDSRNSLFFHMEAGIAFPYGNARMLPFEKRYYAGGANSVRGWTVRGLGPGSYVSRNGSIDYINQSGDIKLDLSLEYRMALFWKFNGALFVDAGNIWTIYDYDDQPDGMFRWNNFHKQIAVAYGVGLRMDLNFLVLRFDAAMKAINPAYLDGPLRYPIANPKFGRDFAWHFAVGYPF